MSLRSRISHILHPRSSSFTGGSDEQHAASRVSSSCELFTLFRALAASKPKDEGIMGDEDIAVSDEHDEQSQDSDEATAAEDDDLRGPDATLRDWRNDLYRGSTAEKDADGAKLAALSLNNLSLEDQSVTPHFSPGPSFDEKLRAICDEFGQIADRMQGDEPERLIAATHGSLFKGVMLIGNLHLTTHRLLFHALLPPQSAFTNNAEATDGTTPNDVLHSGPVTVHKPGLQSARRVWMELAPEMVTTYPKADETGRPLRCILASTIQRLEPFDPEHPLDLVITYEAAQGTKRTHFSVDTEQSARAWRRAFENVLFRHARSRWRARRADRLGVDPLPDDEWTTLRVCIPLDRITIGGTQDYLSFCTLVGLDIELDDELVVWHPEEVGAGSYTGSDTPTKGGNTTQLWTPTQVDIATAPSINQLLRSRNDSNGYPFNIAVLNNEIWFVESLQKAVAASRHRRYKPDATRPSMVFDIGGYNCFETDDDRQTTSSAEIEREEQVEAEGGSLALNTRKQEKASMAAKVFGLREEDGIWMKRCYVAAGVVPGRGHLIVSPRFICFWRRTAVGNDIKYRFRTIDVKSAQEATGTRAAPYALVLKIDGQHDISFDFWHKEARDEAIRHVQTMITAVQTTPPSGSGTPMLDKQMVAEPPTIPHPADILALPKEALLVDRTFPDHAMGRLPFIANKPWKSTGRLTARTFAMFTIGSRGDVQPYIALGLRLIKDGHKVVIITHNEFKKWIEGYGIEHRQAGGDPTALMKLSAEHKMFSPGFFKESLGSYRTWLDELLVDAWKACHDADVLIESPSAMAGIHIAEALKIPYFRAFTMPWTRTTAYPQAFMVPAIEMGPSFNYSTYVLFDNIIWRATSGQINRWRKRHLKLKSTDMTHLSITKVPFLYNFSSAVVPKPLDWHDDITITGYWNLEDSDTDWSPPQDLANFIANARKDERPLVYIGFGSIVVPHPAEMTQNIVKAVEKADVRAVIAKGWSSRGGADEQDVALPESCYGLDKVPHGWLFPQVDAALHHGGAGTTGASLRAGVPTLIKPWFGDQYFWANRVTKLEVGLKVNSLQSDDLAEALIKATSSRVMIEKARRVGELIRAEDGVENALTAISHNIVRAAADRRTMSYTNK